MMMMMIPLFQKENNKYINPYTDEIEIEIRLQSAINPMLCCIMSFYKIVNISFYSTNSPIL